MLFQVYLPESHSAAEIAPVWPPNSHTGVRSAAALVSERSSHSSLNSNSSSEEWPFYKVLIVRENYYNLKKNIRADPN